MQKIQEELSKKDLKKNPRKKKILKKITQLRKDFDSVISNEIYWNLKKTQQTFLNQLINQEDY